MPSEALDLLRSFVTKGHASAAAAAVVTLSDAALFAVGRRRSLRLDTETSTLRPSPAAAVDLDTAFDLASLTKPMSTLGLLARGIGDGSLDLDEPLASALPLAAGSAMAEVPLRSLVGHGSGWPAWRDFATVFDDDRAAGRARRDAHALRHDIVAAVLATPPERPAGVAVVYSDLGYLTLGFLLEARLRRPLDVATFELFSALPVAAPPTYRRTPVGLSPRDNDVVATEIWPRRCRAGWPLQGVVHDDNAAALEGVAGHAGLFASIRGVAAWAREWLRAICGREVALGGALLPEVADLLRRGQAAPDTSWRLGFDTPSRPSSNAGTLCSDATFGHLGFVGTSVFFDPMRGAAVVLLTNRVHPGRDATAAIRALRPALHDAVWRTMGTGFR